MLAFSDGNEKEFLMTLHNSNGIGGCVMHMQMMRGLNGPNGTLECELHHLTWLQ